MVQKKGFSHWLGLLVALILAVAMICMLPFAIAARDLGAVLFSQERVQAILHSRLIETGSLNRILVDTLFGGRSFRGGDEWYKRAAENLSEPERQELLLLIVPPGWIEDQVANLTESVFVWLEDDKPAPDLFLDMQPIKAQLLGDGLDQAVEIFVDSWPSCTPEEAERIQSAFEGGREFPAILCEPPGPHRGLIVEFATRELSQGAAGIPDRVSLLERDSLDLRDLQALKQSLLSTQAFLAWSWLVPLAALGPIMALKIRRLNDLGRWWGLPILLSGGMTFLLNLILRGSRASMINRVLLGLGPLESVQHDLAKALLQSAADQALRLMFVHAIVIAAAGAGIWVLFARRKKVKTVRVSESRPDSADIAKIVAENGGGDRTPPPVPPLSATGDEDHSEGPPSGIFG
ncbi:MAG: hypothetical protein P1P76_00090 [Anaerolineales bacterium]|nr:hypothetical protein [Anaerolineales bacterium]